MKNMPTQAFTSCYFRLQLSFITLISITILPGCSSLFLTGSGTNYQSQEEFVHYVEQVFRLQNNMTSEVMLLLDNDDLENHTALLEAEQRMQTLCADLNEYVSRDIDGLRTGFFLRRRVQTSAKNCDAAAHAVEALLKESKH